MKGKGQKFGKSKREKIDSAQVKISAFFPVTPKREKNPQDACQAEEELKKKTPNLSAAGKCSTSAQETPITNKENSVPCCSGSKPLEQLGPVPRTASAAEKSLHTNRATNIEYYQIDSDSSDDIIEVTPEKCAIRSHSIVKSIPNINVMKVAGDVQTRLLPLKENNEKISPSTGSSKSKTMQSCAREIDNVKAQKPLKRQASSSTGLSPNSKKEKTITDLRKASESQGLGLPAYIQPHRIFSSPSKASNVLPEFQTKNAVENSEAHLGCAIRSSFKEKTGESETTQTFARTPDISLQCSGFGTKSSANKNTTSKCGTSEGSGNLSTDAAVKDIEDLLDGEDIDCEKLAAEMEQMSPFKVPERMTDDCRLSKTAKELKKAGVAKDSYCSLGKFGRHVVLEVRRDAHTAVLHLTLLHLATQQRKTCSLHGSWRETAVREDDVVHVLLCDDLDGHYTISDDSGVIIINPDEMLSSTSVLKGCFCKRKAVLTEMFKGVEPPSQVMLVGSLVHQLFQRAMEGQDGASSEALEHAAKELLQQASVVRDLYRLDLNPKAIASELTEFVPRIVEFMAKYMAPHTRPAARGRGWDGTITEVLQCEEPFWAPRYGVKGRVDLTVAVTDSLGRRVAPLEMKTGRATNSAEHRGQLMLYGLMMEDRRPPSWGPGLLLYLRTPEVQGVATGLKERKELLQLRNEVASCLSCHPAVQEARLPPPLDQRNSCVGCAFRLPCCLLNPRPPPAPHAMATLVPRSLAHLQQNAVQYFRHWCRLLQLEASERRREPPGALWCKGPVARELAGGAAVHLRLSSVRAQAAAKWSHDFQRAPCPPAALAPTLAPNVFRAGESVVVSSRSRLALATGTVQSCAGGVLCVELDRDLLRTAPHRAALYCVDTWPAASVAGQLYAGLLALMADTRPAAALRRLVIDRVPGLLRAGLPCHEVERCQPVLQSLNEDQQRAVFTCLLCRDYCIVSGYPGTGKSVCVVALVRVLTLLGKSVLLTAYTHAALDNLLLKLQAESVSFLRLGHQSRIDPKLKPYADEVVSAACTHPDQLRRLYERQMVVATTCLGLSSHVIFSRRRFDVCIVDEAAQVLLPACLPPLLCADAFVLVGDSRQLPPVVCSPHARKEGLSETLFSSLERTAPADARVALRTQYRMAGPIMRLANALTYDGQLVCASPGLERASLQLPLLQAHTLSSLPPWLAGAVAPTPAVLLLDTAGWAPELDGPTGVANPDEAQIVARIVSALLQLGLTGAEVGVVAPYSAQVRLLQDSLTNRVVACGALPSAPPAGGSQVTRATPPASAAGSGKARASGNGGGVRRRLEFPPPVAEEAESTADEQLKQQCSEVEVRTVDQFQGRDKIVMLYSCVRSCSDEQRAGELLSDERRLNVAITRARRKLVIVGSVRALRLHEPFKRLLQELEPHQVLRFEGPSWQA